MIACREFPLVLKAGVFDQPFIMPTFMEQPGLKRDHDPADASGEDFERLLEVVYDELRRIAHFHRQNERPNLTLQTTALVHEAYLRLANSQTVPRPRDERHMKALTSRIIRRVLVDQARQRKARKRDSGPNAPGLEETYLIDPNLDVDVLDLDAALNRLARQSRPLERVVELRFFGGLTNEEVAAEMDISARTTQRYWQKARIYLLDLLQPPKGRD